MPRAESELPTSQLMVVVAPTAAVASAPRRPTMAESTYCAATWSICSSIVGHASASTIHSVDRFFPFVSKVPAPLRFPKNDYTMSGAKWQCDCVE